MGRIKRKHRPEYAIVQQERALWMKQMEEELPGYGEQNETLHWMVRILTGVRGLYCLFYLIMTFLYGMEKTNALLTLLGPFIFYGWYMLMLQSSSMLTVLMLIGRGASIVWGGVSLLGMSWWLPFPLIFMLVMAAAIEFIEAVFCIYMLFNPLARRTIRLNRVFSHRVRVQVPDEVLEEMAAYKNETEDEDENGEVKS